MKEPKQNNNEVEAESIMTKSDRDSLLQIARQRARVAKTDAASYAAKLRADFEHQLDTHYPWDQDATWEAMAKLMEETKREAASKIAARSRELGIPDWAAPGIGGTGTTEGRMQPRNEGLSCADSHTGKSRPLKRTLEPRSSDKAWKCKRNFSPAR